jgi:predicted nucleotidyltransferase
MSFNWPEFQNEFDVQEHTILLTLAGSRSYGTDHPLSDHDYTGVLIPPAPWLLGPFRNFETTGWKDGETTGRVSEKEGIAEHGREGRIRSLNKFFQEATKCNPNVIEALWVQEDHVVHCTPEGEALRANRELFLNRQAARSFGGYAMSQMKRMELHYGYGHAGRPEVPSRTDFGLPERPKIRFDQQGAADAFMTRYLHELAPWLEGRKNDEKEAIWIAITNICALILEDDERRYDPLQDNWHLIEQETAYKAASALGMDVNFIDYIRLEKAYGALVKEQKDYDNWVQNRNPARHELESKYGYDCKHAMHLFRLLRMGKELMSTGQLHVYRPDREELQEIRNGQWEYARVISEGKALLEEVYDLARSDDCPLPKTPDQQKLQALHNQLVLDFYRRKNYI